MISYTQALANFAKEFKERDKKLCLAKRVYNPTIINEYKFKKILDLLKEQMDFVFYPHGLTNINFLFFASIASQDELVGLLNKMLGFESVSSSDKEVIKGILALIKKAEERFHFNSKTEGGSNQLYEKIAPALEEKDRTEQNRRFFNLLDFSLKTATNNQKRIEPKDFNNNVGSFEGLGRKELVSMFSPNVFYNLSDKQIMQLLQATANEYAETNGAFPCEVSLARLSSSNGGVTLGEYDPNSQTIEINSNFLRKLNDFKAEGNAYAPYQLLSTLIHETQHHVQTTNLNKKNSELTAREKMACVALSEPNSTNYGEYLISPDELDARDCALGYLRQACALAEKGQAEELASVYAVAKREEESRPKPPVGAKIESTFDNVYGKVPGLEGAPNYMEYITNRTQMMDIMRGITRARNLAEEKTLRKY